MAGNAYAARAFVGLIIVTMVAAGCGGGSAPTSVSDTSDDVATVPDRAPEGEVVDYEDWTFSRVDEVTGDEMDGVISLGPLGTPESAPPLQGGQSLEDAPCVVDPERDLVAPGSLEITNANAEFTQDLNVSFFANDIREPSYGSDGPYLSIAGFWDTPECEEVTRNTYFDGQNSFGLSRRSAEPGASVSVDFYLVVPDVRTPAHPDGDPEALASLQLVFYGGPSTDGSTFDVTDLSPNWGSTTGSTLFPVVPLSAIAGPDASGYTLEVETNFVDACRTGASSSGLNFADARDLCGCVFEKVRDEMPFEEFEAMDEDLDADSSEPTAEVRGFRDECAETLGLPPL